MFQIVYPLINRAAGSVVGDRSAALSFTHGGAFTAFSCGAMRWAMGDGDGRTVRRGMSNDPSFSKFGREKMDTQI